MINKKHYTVYYILNHIKLSRNLIEIMYSHLQQKIIYSFLVTENSAFQPWSILWYIGSFGGLIAFFLIVSCSEWCCRNRSRELNSELTTPSSPTPSENPPPAYDLFAPPSYDSLCHNEEKSEYDVYVVPVHALSAIAENSALQTDDTPPAYSSDRQIQISNTNEVLLNVSSIDEDYTERHKAT